MKKNSFDRTIDQAVEDFQQILAPCVSTSATSLSPNVDERRQRAEKQFNTEAKTRHGEDFLHSLRQPRTATGKQREPKVDCRQWCEENRRQIAESQQQQGLDFPDDRTRVYRSKIRKSFGSSFYCRKTLLQKPNGTTFICIRKRAE